MITSWSNYIDRNTDEHGEFKIGSTVSNVSKTIPGQTLPLVELLRRYRRGQNVEVFEPVYTDEPQLDGIENLSKIERAALELNIKLERAALELELSQSIRSFRQNTTKQKQSVENQPVANNQTDSEQEA